MFQGSFLSLIIGFLSFVQLNAGGVDFQPSVSVDFDNQQALSSEAFLNKEGVTIHLFLSGNLDSKKIVLEELPLLKSIYESNDLVDWRAYYVSDVQLPYASWFKCAADQNAYWPFLNEFYREIESINARSFYLLAKKVEIDGNVMARCINDKKYQASVEKDLGLYQSLNSEFTPLMVIQQNKYIGHQPFENIKKVIDQRLSDIQKQKELDLLSTNSTK